jgi:hypothetical protein
MDHIIEQPGNLRETVRVVVHVEKWDLVNVNVEKCFGKGV